MFANTSQNHLNHEPVRSQPRRHPFKAIIYNENVVLPGFRAVNYKDSLP